MCKSDFKSLPIPKGLRPKAQGCEERATLGQRIRKTKPQRGFGFDECALPVATPSGLLSFALFTQGSSCLATRGLGDAIPLGLAVFQNLICAHRLLSQSSASSC